MSTRILSMATRASTLAALLYPSLSRLPHHHFILSHPDPSTHLCQYHYSPSSIQQHRLLSSYLELYPNLQYLALPNLFPIPSSVSSLWQKVARNIYSTAYCSSADFPQRKCRW